MAILIDETKRVIVQGITGREGRARAKLMKEYGTHRLRDYRSLTPSRRRGRTWDRLT
jgi:succinyl-CoA synthetase alpha subunit